MPSMEENNANSLSSALQELSQRASKPLAEQIASQLNQLILDKNLHRGDKLPNEYDLAVILNVGRSTVREAIKLLVARNVLEIKRGKGTFVRENMGVTDDPLGFAYAPDQLRLAIDLIEIRMQLEPWITSLAAQRATDQEVEELQKRCDAVTAKIRVGEDHGNADIQLHTYIAACTHNQVMPELVHTITYCVAIFTKFRSKDLLKGTIASHEAIIDAIRRHDPVLAYQAMAGHITNNFATIRSIMIEQNREDILQSLDQIEQNSMKTLFS